MKTMWEMLGKAPPEVKRRAPREQEILDWLANGLPRTDREIAAALGYEDMNCIRPRVTELVKRGQLKPAGKRRCFRTGKLVRTVRMAA